MSQLQFRFCHSLKATPIPVQQVAAWTPPSLSPEEGTQGRQVLSPWVFAEQELHPQRQSCQTSFPPPAGVCMDRTSPKWVSKPSSSLGCSDFIWTMQESAKNELMRFKNPPCIVAKILGVNWVSLFCTHGSKHHAFYVTFRWVVLVSEPTRVLFLLLLWFLPSL